MLSGDVFGFLPKTIEEKPGKLSEKKVFQQNITNATPPDIFSETELLQDHLTAYNDLQTISNDYYKIPKISSYFSTSFANNLKQSEDYIVSPFVLYYTLLKYWKLSQAPPRSPDEVSVDITSIKNILFVRLRSATRNQESTPKLINSLNSLSNLFWKRDLVKGVTIAQEESVPKFIFRIRTPDVVISQVNWIALHTVASGEINRFLYYGLSEVFKGNPDGFFLMSISIRLLIIWQHLLYHFADEPASSLRYLKLFLSTLYTYSFQTILPEEDPASRSTWAPENFYGIFVNTFQKVQQ